MILDSVELRNYRCFTDLRVPLDRHLNVFVGTNASGKSSVLHAIAACLAPVLSRLPLEKKSRAKFLTVGDIHQIGPDVRAPFVQLTARGRLNGTSDPLQWTVGRLSDPSEYTRNTTRAVTGWKPAADVDLKTLHQALDRKIEAHQHSLPYTVPTFALYGTSRAVDIPQYRSRPTKLPTHFRRLMGLEGALESTADFRHAVAWFDWLSVRELRERDEGTLTGPLPELEAVRLAITSMLPEIRRPRIDAQSGKFTVDTLDPAGQPIRLLLDQLSDGYQVLLGVVMDFALRLAIANPQPTPAAILRQEAILMIDEVDLHLHPAWQQRVIPDLRRTFPQTQLILTTHSPQVATTVPCVHLRILRDARLYGAPQGTDGAEAQRLLEDVFGVSGRPSHMPMAQQLEHYLELIRQRKWNTDEARELRRSLDRWSGGHEPKLLEADLAIENLEWEAAG